MQAPAFAHFMLMKRKDINSSLWSLARARISIDFRKLPNQLIGVQDKQSKVTIKANMLYNKVHTRILQVIYEMEINLDNQQGLDIIQSRLSRMFQSNDDGKREPCSCSTIYIYFRLRLK